MKLLCPFPADMFYETCNASQMEVRNGLSFKGASRSELLLEVRAREAESKPTAEQGVPDFEKTPESSQTLFKKVQTGMTQCNWKDSGVSSVVGLLLVSRALISRSSRGVSSPSLVCCGQSMLICRPTLGRSKDSTQCVWGGAAKGVCRAYIICAFCMFTSIFRFDCKSVGKTAVLVLHSTKYILSVCLREHLLHFPDVAFKWNLLFFSQNSSTKVFPGGWSKWTKSWLIGPSARSSMSPASTPAALCSSARVQ